MNAKLIMFREDGSRREFELAGGVTTIGRQEDCCIRIPLGEVSRRHAEIDLDEDGIVLRDLGASNGTFLNNRRIEGEEDLQPGDQITIGPVVFTLQINGEPSDDELVAVRTRISNKRLRSTAQVGTSQHVYMASEEIDPIFALEALASSTDQTAINPEVDE